MKKEIQKIVEQAVLELRSQENWGDFEMPQIQVEHPKEENFGDYSTNVAMILAGKIKKNPIEIAEKIVAWLSLPHPSPLLKKGEGEFGEIFEKIEVAKPGYVNFFLSARYWQKKVEEINELENKFGNSEIGKGKKINNEFISANPTGPLTVGNGRGGFFGDVLSKIFRKNGFEVVSEYYVNDGGGQILKLGHSVLKDSEASYSGEYIDELNKKYGNLSIEEVGKESAKFIIENIIKKIVEEKMKIKFDEWMSEKSLYDNGYIEKAIEVLKEKKLTYEKEDALWLRTTEFGDDKDRVLIKGDGQKTYFASDCGYIINKKERGFDKIIEIWGADHHGYISRFQAAAEALGFEKENIKFIITQLVRVVKDGKEVRMSKRAGNVVYIDELIDEVGHDVARFFFLMYSPDTHMNFDLNLAKEQSEKNPVYYVQYAYARISSILAKAESLNLTTLPRQVESSLLEKEGEILNHERELNLIRELDKFPELVEEIAGNYEAHKLPQYAIKLADKFHSFYNDCRVIDEENLELTTARLNLVKAVRIVLGETLKLIGVSAPEKM